MSLPAKDEEILMDQKVAIHPLNMLIRFKSGRPFAVVASEGVYEEVYLGLVIRPYLHQ